METENTPVADATTTDTPVEVEAPITEEVKVDPVVEDKVQEEVTQPKVDELDLAELTANIDKILEEAKIVVTEPSFFPEKDDEDVTKVIDDLMELNDKIQSELNSKDEEVQAQVWKVTELTSKIEEMQSQIEAFNDEKITLEATIEAMEETWEKLLADPIIWPINKARASWEEIDIPSFIKKYVEENQWAFPNFDWEKAQTVAPPQVNPLRRALQTPSF